MKKSKLIIAAVFAALLGGIFQLLLNVPLTLSHAAFAFEVLFFLVALFYTFSWTDDYNDALEIARFFVVPGLVVIAIVVYGFAGGAIFNLREYKNSAETKSSITVDFDTTVVQVVDKDSAMKLGDRVFGQIGQELVSQFKVGNYYQSVYKGRLVRIAPIEYVNLFSYLNNNSTPGYILVDCETGESKVIESDISYTGSAFFGKDLSRHMFFYNMFYQYSSPIFELDDNGNPYYISAILSRKAGRLADIEGVLTVEATTGKIEEYTLDNVPEWVDNVHPVSVTYDKFNRAMRYVNGLFNFSKKGVVQFTEDYSYLMNDGHLYFYTGVTSVSNDESNIGYVYADCHTGEIHYTESFGAEEFSARASAEGVLQEKGYASVFPTLVNLDGNEAYFMALKDNAGLIKAYALVSYKDYQKAVVGSTPEEAVKNFLGGSTTVTVDEFNLQDIEISITKIEKIVMDGNTIVILVNDNDEIFSYNMSNGDLRVALLEVGETIKVSVDLNGNICELK